MQSGREDIYSVVYIPEENSGKKTPLWWHQVTPLVLSLGLLLAEVPPHVLIETVKRGSASTYGQLHELTDAVSSC